MEVQKDSGTLMFVVENHGPNFGRIAELEVQGTRQKGSLGGFPLFPGSRRRLEIAWKGDDPPEAVILKAREFSFEQKLSKDR
jgi:hypothetical protein